MYSIITLLCFIFFQLNNNEEKISLELVASSSEDAPLTNVMSLDFKSVNSSLIIYAADIFTPSVLEFSLKENNLILTENIGQHGKGPGDFENVSTVQVLQDGRLLIYDKNLGRATIYDESKIDKIFSIRTTDSRYLPMELYQFGNQNNYLALSRKFFQASDDKIQNREIHLSLIGTEGELLKDSILVKPSNDALVVINDGNMAVNPNPPFGKKSLFRFSGEKIYYGWTGGNKIEIFSKAGNLEKNFEIDLTPKRIDNDDMELAKEASNQIFRETIVKQATENWPMYHDFNIDEKGNFWIAESAHFKDEMRVWGVYNSVGNLVQKIELPLNLKIFQVKSGYVLGVYKDKKNQPIIQLHKIIYNNI